MDIDYVLKCLSEISEDDLYTSEHFEIRINQRKNDLIPDSKSIRTRMIKNKPVSIAKQSETKFKLLYELGDGHDLAVIISSRTLNPISFNLVTTFVDDSKKRLREDK